MKKSLPKGKAILCWTVYGDELYAWLKNGARFYTTNSTVLDDDVIIKGGQWFNPQSDEPVEFQFDKAIVKEAFKGWPKRCQVAIATATVDGTYWSGERWKDARSMLTETDIDEGCAKYISVTSKEEEWKTKILNSNNSMTTSPKS